MSFKVTQEEKDNIRKMYQKPEKTTVVEQNLASGINYQNPNPFPLPQAPAPEKKTITPEEGKRIEAAAIAKIINQLKAQVLTDVGRKKLEADLAKHTQYYNYYKQQIAANSGAGQPAGGQAAGGRSGGQAGTGQAAGGIPPASTASPIVKQIQDKLISMKIDIGPADGKLGPKTLQGIMYALGRLDQSAPVPSMASKGTTGVTGGGKPSAALV